MCRHALQLFKARCVPEIGRGVETLEFVVKRRVSVRKSWRGLGVKSLTAIPALIVERLMPLVVREGVRSSTVAGGLAAK